MAWLSSLVPAVLLGATSFASPAAVAPLAPTVIAKTAPIVVGDPAKFVFREPAGSAPPATFEYAVMSGPPVSVPAGGGRAVVKIRFLKRVTTLTVVAVGADGSRSPQTSVVVNANAAPVAADQDHDGDGRPDLLTIGGTPGLASGLWQATGRANRGQVRLPATDVGVHGLDLFHGPSDFDGAQVITGKFTGSSFEDFGVYFPSGPRAGAFVEIDGTGDGSPPDTQSSDNIHMLVGDSLADINGNNPLQLINVYGASGSPWIFPDLLATIGDPVDGYSLDLYANQNGLNNYMFPVDLAQPTPTGGTDWNHWRLASKLLSSGPAVALLNDATGALYLWTNVTYDATTGHLAFTQYLLSAAWPGAAGLATYQLTDVNADGVPDVWAVSEAGDVTAYLVSNLSPTGTATMKAQPSQHLTPDDLALDGIASA